MEIKLLIVSTFECLYIYFSQGKMQPQGKEWGWIDCNLTIKRANKKNQNQVFQILESEYTIQLEEDDTEAELNIEITMEKKINYEEEAGFIWHKSWNIPSLEVKISKRDLNAIKNQLGINRVYCQITSGYPIRKIVQFYLQEVSLEGETRKQIGNNGVARFSNLKFSQTSFNHERNKFSLIIIIFTKNEERSRSVLKSFISMPIYVDSRREARKKAPNNSFISDLIPVEAFQEELEQRHFEKKMAKAKLKPGKDNAEQKNVGKSLIRYNLSGFIAYYKSANIRNKIKHPFYFCYHFHPNLSLFYNRQLASSPLQVLKLLEKPSKHDAKKQLLVCLTPGEGEDSKEVIEDFKKQVQLLFEGNWKYYFIETCVKNSNIFAHMMQEKCLVERQGQEQETSKWVHISREELLNVYREYYIQIENRQNQEMKNLNSSSPVQNEISADNNRKYQHFELHQTIFIQSAFKNSEPVKKVKVQQNDQYYQ